MSKEINNNRAFPSVQSLEEERARLQGRDRWRRAIIRSLAVLLTVAAVAVLVTMLFLPVLRVSGSSMEPNISNGDILIGIKSGSFETGQICCFYYNNKILLKRVIGSAGDIINMDSEGYVYVNGQKLVEPYIREPSVGISDMEYPLQVPEGQLFVMGDYRATSVDSRSSVVGFVSTDDVVGKMFFRIWPFEGFGQIK